jgi:hypothetical protein
MVQPRADGLYTIQPTEEVLTQVALLVHALFPANRYAAQLYPMPPTKGYSRLSHYCGGQWRL